MITLKEIAERCGVSVATVSNILNGKPKVGEATRRRVLEVLEETGYQPNYLARDMRRKHTRTIGIITEDLKEFSATPIVESIMAVCEEWKYRTILINMRMYDKWQDKWYQDREKILSELLPALREMQSIRVDGIIYVAGHCREIDYFPTDFSLPILVAYGLSSDGRYPSVVLDDEAGGYDMTNYLIFRGHKKIGVIAGKEDNLHTRQRFAGYRRALRDAGLNYDPGLVRYGQWNRASGSREMEALLEKDITAVFCMNDRMAAGVYDTLQRRGLEVGRDYSVVGYDNHVISEFLFPLLTTCDMQLEKLGRQSSEILLEQLGRNDTAVSPAQVVRVRSSIVVRDSVRDKA